MNSPREIRVPGVAPVLEVVVRSQPADGGALFEIEQRESLIYMYGREQAREVGSALLELADQEEAGDAATR